MARSEASQKNTMPNSTAAGSPMFPVAAASRSPAVERQAPLNQRGQRRARLERRVEQHVTDQRHRGHPGGGDVDGNDELRDAAAPSRMPNHAPSAAWSRPLAIARRLVRRMSQSVPRSTPDSTPRRAGSQRRSQHRVKHEGALCHPARRCRYRQAWSAGRADSVAAWWAGNRAAGDLGGFRPEELIERCRLRARLHARAGSCRGRSASRESGSMGHAASGLPMPSVQAHAMRAASGRATSPARSRP